MTWTIKVVRKSSVPLCIDLEILSALNIQYYGETRKDILTDKEKLMIFNTLDFNMKGKDIEVYI